MVNSWDFMCFQGGTPTSLGFMAMNIQCGAPKIAKLVQITPITMVYGCLWYS